MKLSEFIKWYRENEDNFGQAPWDAELAWVNDEMDWGGSLVHGSGPGYESDAFDSPYPEVREREAEKVQKNIKKAEYDSQLIANSRNTMPDIVAALERAKFLMEYFIETNSHPNTCREFLQKYFPSEES